MTSTGRRALRTPPVRLQVLLLTAIPLYAAAQAPVTPPLSAVATPPAASPPPTAPPAADAPAPGPTSSESPPAPGQPAPETNGAAGGSPEQWLERVKAQREAAAANAEFDEPTRAKLLELYDALIKEIQARIERNQQIETHRRQIASAPKDIEEAERALAALASEPNPPPPSADLAQLRARLAAQQAELVKAQQSARQIQGRIERRPRQLADLPQRIESLGRRIEELRVEMATPPPPDERPEVARVRQTLLRARMGNAEAEREAAEVERLALQGNGGVLAKRLEIETRRASLLEREIAALSERIERAEERRQQELARRALVAAASEDPRIQAVITKNRELAADLNNTEEFRKNEQKLRERLVDLAALIDQVESEYQATRKRLEIGGSNVVMGSMMRASHEALPDLRVHRRRLTWAANTAAEAALRKIEIDENLRKLADVDARIGALLGRVPAEFKSHKRLAQEETLRGHLLTQRELYQSAQTAYEDHLRMLAEFDQQTRKLIDSVQEFDEFIAERIFWVPSAKPVGPADLPLLWQAGLDLADPDRWSSVWEIAQRDFFETPAPYLLAGAILLAYGLLRFRIRGRLRTLAERVSKSYVKTIPETLFAFVLTLVLAALCPAAMLLVGYRLMHASARPEVYAAGWALCVVAFLLFLIEFLRASCRTSGLGVAHFRWRASSAAVLRRNLHWLVLAAPPLAVVMSLLRGDADPAHVAGVRAAFMVAMVLLAVFCARVFAKDKGVAETVMSASKDGWIARTHRLWRPVLVLLPLSLAALAGFGYVDTALFLNKRLVASAALAAAILFSNGLLLRWLWAVRGRLAIEQARKRREAEAQQDLEGGDTVVLEPELVDLSVVNQQTRKLLSLSVGLAALLGAVFIWSDVVPAFRMLDRVAFWSKSTVAWEMRTNSETGASLLEKIERTEPVTLRTFAVSLLTILVATAAAKNLPGLLEIVLLARLPLDAGARFAVTTVARYAITIVGLVLVSNQLGIRWDSVQWLAAAFTVGLGFGLQEIVANFVSGLILLWERPIRIGDLITVGDQSGTVTRIQMRATTVTNFEKKEMIIPNKSFITSQVVNWTLSDRVIRVQLAVGVKYGTDTAKVTEILYSIARSHPYVLSDPAPRALFDRFGESTLDFLLNVYVDNVDHAFACRHEINTRINEEFAKAGIEIAFPQRDVNLRGATLSLADADGEAQIRLGDKSRRASA